MKAPTRFRIPLPDFRRVAQPVGGATHLPPALLKTSSLCVIPVRQLAFIEAPIYLALFKDSF
jgi:hypothetical protein